MRGQEETFPNVSSTFYKAISNLWFLDRLMLITAKFRDTHLKLEPVMSLPLIDLGIRFKRLSNGSFVVSKIDRTLKEYLDSQNIDLEIGNLVYTIGGKVASEAEKMARYIPSSSELYRVDLGLDAITSRHFRYPKNPFTTLTFRSNSGRVKTVDLEWTYSYSYNRTDAIFYLHYLGFRFQWRDFRYDSRDSGLVNHMTNNIDWYSAKNSDELVQRSGFVHYNGQSVGVLQIFSFHETNVRSSKHGNVVPWDEPIAAFMRELERKRIPLILDVRRHQGGIVEHPIRLMRLLAREDESYPSYVEGFRLTPSIHQMWQRVDSQDLFDINDKRVARKIRTAIARGEEYSGVWDKSEPITSPGGSGGFNQKIVVMISSSCVSACDILAILLESSNRATLVGTPTNGTGAGYFDWDPYDSSSYVDLYEIFRIQIPNLLFGHSIQDGPEYFGGGEPLSD